MSSEVLALALLPIRTPYTAVPFPCKEVANRSLADVTLSTTGDLLLLGPWEFIRVAPTLMPQHQTDLGYH